MRDSRGRALAVAVLLAILTACEGGATSEPLAPTPSTTLSPQTGAKQLPTTTPAPQDWSPVREGALATQQGRSLDDPNDASVPWVDVTLAQFRYDFDQPTWSIELAAKPPKAASLEPGELIAYGVVLETTGDGVADFLIGIDNDAPTQGDFHVWVTDLATGKTDEQIGPPYGVPIDFAHPDEAGRGPYMDFFFLPGEAPTDLNPKTVRWYAWASASSGGEVYAWDYAPDAGWATGL